MLLRDGPRDRTLKKGIDEVLGGTGLRPFLGQFAQLVNQLEQAVNGLPHVEEDGASECPFAEDLYARKEELEEKVSSGMQKLHSCMAYLNQEIQRCKANLGTIAADTDRLKLTETRDSYSHARTEQERQYRSAVQDRDAIHEVLIKAEAILRISRMKKFPGRKPRKKSPFPLGPLGGDMGPDNFRQTKPLPGLGNELDGLISLGPRRELRSR